MNIKVIGKNIDLGEAFQEYSQKRLNEIFEKYSYNVVSSQITLEKKFGSFKAKLKVNLKNKIELDATGLGKEANIAFEDAIDRTEKRLRRYHRKMKNHRPLDFVDTFSTNEPMWVYESATNSSHQNPESAENDSLPVIAELSYRVEELTVEQAVMRLEFANESCLLFRNASHSGLNLVYIRHDGNIGWVDPRGSRENTIQGSK